MIILLDFSRALKKMNLKAEKIMETSEIGVKGKVGTLDISGKNVT